MTGNTRIDRRPLRAHKALALGLAVALVGAACGVETERYGNTVTDCPTNSSCSCGSGNCVMGCPGGGCDLTCTGTSNCSFDCAGGGCTVSCANTGNCFATCAGGGCDMACTGIGNCGITQCSAGCTLTCNGTGNCF